MKENSRSASRAARKNMKFEIANELGINLDHTPPGSLTSRQNGSIGGRMVKRMIEDQEKQMNGK